MRCRFQSEAQRFVICQMFYPIRKHERNTFTDSGCSISKLLNTIFSSLKGHHKIDDKIDLAYKTSKLLLTTYMSFILT